jgi:hypothetical protein
LKQAAAESLRVLDTLLDVEALVGSARPAPSQDSGDKGQEGAGRGANNGSEVRGQEMQQNMQQVMERAESSMPVLPTSVADDSGKGWRHTLSARVWSRLVGRVWSRLVARVLQPQRQTTAAVVLALPIEASPNSNSSTPISSSIAARHASSSSSSSSAPPPAASSGPPSIADL